MKKLSRDFLPPIYPTRAAAVIVVATSAIDFDFDFDFYSYTLSSRSGPCGGVRLINGQGSQP